MNRVDSLLVANLVRVPATKSSPGFAAPLICADAAAHCPTGFHDATSGNNSGGTAAVNWDCTTGFTRDDVTLNVQ